MRTGTDDPVSREKPAVWPVALLALAAMLALAAGVQARDPGDEQAPERIGKGRISFRLYCRSCHGKLAKGDGPVAEHLKIPPSDLTAISARRDGGFPAEEMRRMIDGRDPVKGHGSRDMPIWGEAFKVSAETQDEAVVEEKITQLIFYLKSIQQEGGA